MFLCCFYALLDAQSGETQMYIDYLLPLMLCSDGECQWHCLRWYSVPSM